MGLIKQSSGTRTLATGATTDTVTFTNVFGKIQKVVATFSGTSSDFKLYTLAGDGATVVEYILGASGATITQANNTTAYYPRAGAVTIANGAITNSFVNYVTIGSIKVDVTNVAQTETWSVELYYDDQN